jgi:hypothetical protein
MPGDHQAHRTVRLFVAAISLCLCLAACQSGSQTSDTSTTLAGESGHSSQTSSPVDVPTTRPPTLMPARFMPSGGWHLTIGVGEQAILAISPTKVLNHYDYVESAQTPLTSEGQLRLVIVSSNLLFVRGTAGLTGFFLSTDASGRHLYERNPTASDAPGSISAVFCAGSIQDSQCGG